jgi:hypothetical protein
MLPATHPTLWAPSYDDDDGRWMDGSIKLLSARDGREGNQAPPPVPVLLSLSLSLSLIGLLQQLHCMLQASSGYMGNKTAPFVFVVQYGTFEFLAL